MGSYLGVWMARFDDGQNQYINLFSSSREWIYWGMASSFRVGQLWGGIDGKTLEKKQTDIYEYFSIMVNVYAIAPGKNS